MKKISTLVTGFIICTLFSATAIAQGPLTCYHFNIFDTTTLINSGNYLELKDGTKVTGGEIKSKGRWVSIDDKKYEGTEVLRYLDHGRYYIRFNSGYIKCLVYGDLISIYWEDNAPRDYPRYGKGKVCDHYVQLGNTGDLERIDDFKELISYVKTCSKAVEMLDKNYKELNKAIRSNRSHLNDAIKVYNNGCH